MLARRVHVAVALAEEAPAVGFVVRGGDDQAGDAVRFAVEGDDADYRDGVFAGCEVGGVFCGEGVCEL